MVKKRTTLPKDFEEFLSKSSFQELKNVFDKCDVNARGGFGKQTALAYDKCPNELAEWLVGQGGDLQATDIWGNTPLHTRARSIFGNIKSLLALGADVNDKQSSIGTPLHAAADSHNIENTILLLQYGAKINELNSRGYTPLEQALITCNNIDIVKTLAISKAYLSAGVKTTSGMKESVTKIGERFEFSRANFSKDSVTEVSNALIELYKIYGVEPMAKRVLHDGKSLIKVNGDTWQQQHQYLWDILVPPNGPAETIQGEVIRITGRVANELDGNGGINWDADYKKMADAFIGFAKQGKQLSHSNLLEAEELINEIKQKSGDCARLCELAVKWVIDNPTPLKLQSVEYKR